MLIVFLDDWMIWRLLSMAMHNTLSCYQSWSWWRHPGWLTDNSKLSSCNCWTHLSHSMEVSFRTLNGYVAKLCSQFLVFGMWQDWLLQAHSSPQWVVYCVCIRIKFQVSFNTRKRVILSSTICHSWHWQPFVYVKTFFALHESGTSQDDEQLACVMIQLYQTTR